MDFIRVLTFPYAAEPMAREIENNIDSFMQIVEGKIDDFKIDDNYVIIMNRSYDPETEDYKYQEQYGIYGNFIIIKHTEEGLTSMTDEDVEYAIENARDLLKLRA